jgi:protein ImuB
VVVDVKAQDAMFGVVYGAEGTAREVLEAVAREFSPRIEACGSREVTVDLSGLTRLFGDARTIAEELRRTSADRGLRVRVAIAATRSAARLLVRHRAGITVVEPGTEAAVLALLPLGLLSALTNAAGQNGPNARNGANVPNEQNGSNDPNHPNDPNDVFRTLRQWGVRTLGEFAALAPDEVAARLGQEGVEFQRLARGGDPRPLVPTLPEERFEQALDLEWPIDGLEPLSFVLGRLMEPLEAHLARRDRGAAVLHLRLHLIKTEGAVRAVHERSLQLPAPMRDARALRTLALLDLESHPPDAPIDRVVVAIDPTPGRIVQFSLLTRALPSPERLSTLMARLSALMGEDRCGSPAPVDTWQPGAFAMKPFAPRDSDAVHRHEPQRHGDSEITKAAVPSVPLWFVAGNDAASPVVALRRFRIPIPARVRVEGGAPVRVAIDRRGFSGGRVQMAAGPWRTSGAWWRDDRWERDEWDATLSDGATYRLYRERDTEQWFIEGIVD